MAVTSTIPLQSPERSSKSEIRIPPVEEMADVKLINSAAAAVVVAAGSEPRLPEGKSCHQCRQRFYTVAADCLSVKRKGSKCVIKYCTKCLRNRYGEKTDEVMRLEYWECPLCRGICNCSACLRKLGLQPTGKVYNTARGSGYDNVKEFLSVKGNEFLTPLGSTSGRARSARKNGDGERKRRTKRPRKIVENVGDGLPPAAELPSASELPPAPELPAASELLEVSVLRILEEAQEPQPQLPEGVELREVGRVQMPNEDVGNAMQFLRFCSTFEKTLKFEQDPEMVLSNIFKGQPEEIAPVVLCQIRLLTLIMDPSDNPPLDPADGERCWLRTLKDCISQSELQRGRGLQSPNLTTNAEYAALSPSEKLRILVLLCDESLQTAELRDAIEQLYAEFIDGKKEARIKCQAAKKKEKQLQKQMQAVDEKAAVDENGNPLPIPEDGDSTADVKADPVDVRAEIAESQTLLAKYKRKPDALRVAPLFVESSGQVYWRMYEGSQLLRQELNGAGPDELTEKWYVFNDEEAKLIDKHIAANKTKRRRKRRDAEQVESSSADEDPPESVAEPGPSQVEPEPDHCSPSLDG